MIYMIFTIIKIELLSREINTGIRISIFNLFYEGKNVTKFGNKTFFYQETFEVV